MRWDDECVTWVAVGRDFEGGAMYLGGKGN